MKIDYFFYSRWIEKNFVKMVITFLISKNFEKNASKLDTLRLGKQRVEAKQILNILESFDIISFVYEYEDVNDIDDDKRRYKTFNKNVRNYITQDTRVVLNTENMELRIINKKSVSNFNSLSPEDKTKKFNKLKKVDTKNFTVKYTSPLIKDIRVLTLGFSQHPIVKMWCGYQDSLKCYIMSCADEWKKRPTKDGGKRKDNTPTWDLKYEDVKHPWWIKCKHLRYSHIAALLRKEKERKEKPWYWNIYPYKFKKLTPYINRGYIWISNIDVSNYQMMKDVVGKKLENLLEKVCWVLPKSSTFIELKPQYKKIVFIEKKYKSANFIGENDFCDNKISEEIRIQKNKNSLTLHSQKKISRRGFQKIFQSCIDDQDFYTKLVKIEKDVFVFQIVKIQN